MKRVLSADNPPPPKKKKKQRKEKQQTIKVLASKMIIPIWKMAKFQKEGVGCGNL